jgi:hypothetical protein
VLSVTIDDDIIINHIINRSKYRAKW